MIVLLLVVIEVEEGVVGHKEDGGVVVAGCIFVVGL